MAPLWGHFHLSLRRAFGPPRWALRAIEYF